MSKHSFSIQDDGTTDRVVGGPDPECAAVLLGRRLKDWAVAIGVIVEVAEEQPVEAVRLALASVTDYGDDFSLENNVWNERNVKREFCATS